MGAVVENGVFLLKTKGALCPEIKTLYTGILWQDS